MLPLAPPARNNIGDTTLASHLLGASSLCKQMVELRKLSGNFLTFSPYLALLCCFYTLIECFGFVRSFYWMKHKMAKRQIARNKKNIACFPARHAFQRVYFLYAKLLDNSRATCCSPFLTAALSFAAAASSRIFLSHAYRARD